MSTHLIPFDKFASPFQCFVDGHRFELQSVNSRLRPSHFCTSDGWQRLSSVFGVLPWSAPHSLKVIFFSGESSNLLNALCFLFRPKAAARKKSLQNHSVQSHTFRAQGPTSGGWRCAVDWSLWFHALFMFIRLSCHRELN